MYFDVRKLFNSIFEFAVILLLLCDLKKPPEVCRTLVQCVWRELCAHPRRLCHSCSEQTSHSAVASYSHGNGQFTRNCSESDRFTEKFSKHPSSHNSHSSTPEWFMYMFCALAGRRNYIRTLPALHAVHVSTCRNTSESTVLNLQECYNVVTTDILQSAVIKFDSAHTF